MEAKKKKRLWIIIPIVCVLVVSAALITFFTIRNKNNSNSPSTVETSNVSNNVSEIDFNIKVAILNKEQNVNYNGTYKFSSISSIEYNPDLEDNQKSKVYNNFGGGAIDENGLHDYLISQKQTETTSEIIVLNSGKFTRSKNDSIIEEGIFYGNLDKSEVYTLDEENGTIEYHGYKYSYSYDISQTGYGKTDLNVVQANAASTTGTKLYITEHTYSSKTPSLRLFSVTYVYDMIKIEQKKIPDSYII